MSFSYHEYVQLSATPPLEGCAHSDRSFGENGITLRRTLHEFGTRPHVEGVRQGHVACRVDIGGSVGGRNGEYLLTVSFAVVGEVVVRRGVGAPSGRRPRSNNMTMPWVAAARYKAEGPCRHRTAYYVNGHRLRPLGRGHGPYMDGEGLCVAEHRRSIGRVGGRNRASEHLLARAGVYECLGVVGLIELCIVVRA